MLCKISSGKPDACRQTFCRGVISADAHHADHLTRNFAEAEKLLQELGI